MKMKSAARRTRSVEPPPITDDIPLLYEDEDEGDMGEAAYHTDSDDILFNGLKSHFAGRKKFRVFSNLNLYYTNRDPRAYVSPDAMVVTPTRPLGEYVTSYRIGVDGPAPILTAEVLSERTSQQRDLDEKMRVYALIGVAEYLLVDVTGQFLAERLLLKRLLADGSWEDHRNPDGGITSQLGFRVIIDVDGRVRVLNARTGRRYVRPDEADDIAIEAEQRIHELEKELERFRAKLHSKEKKSKSRRKPKK
jgi:Uma2 family endonuclease